MELKKLERIAEEYSDLYTAKLKQLEVKPFSHFSHISGNITSLMQEIVALMMVKGLQDEWKDTFFSNKEAVERYWRLIENHEDFRDVEISTGPNVYFPEGINMSEPKKYISYATQRLEGEES